MIRWTISANVVVSVAVSVAVAKERNNENKYLKEVLKETVKEIQGYSKEELEKKLSESKYSIIAKTVDEIIGFAEYPSISNNTLSK